jgi:asparagine synthetase B (glutamine-hydrolysing)
LDQAVHDWEATACEFNPFCLSSFLTFRYVVKQTAEWAPAIRPRWPVAEATDRIDVKNAGQLLEALRLLVDRAVRQQPVGLLLGGGMDSAILAALLPRGTPAYTVRFQAEQPIDESPVAARYARRCGLPHRVVTVTWDDYEERAEWLMRHKRSPLHPVEVALSLAACVAKADGVEALVAGNGADSKFGGLDRLLCRDWTLEEFMQRYTFVEPSSALAERCSMKAVFEEYTRLQNVDVAAFLRGVHGPGLAQAFDNAISAAGCVCVAPYEGLALATPLDLMRIRRGEPKYLLREIFTQLFPGLPVAKKIAFARPMDSWMSTWNGPTRAEFKLSLEVKGFSGEQKWLLYCLEKFMDMMENE